METRRISVSNEGDPKENQPRIDSIRAGSNQTRNRRAGSDGMLPLAALPKKSLLKSIANDEQKRFLQNREL
jgi:hypothetical protein